VGPRRERFFFPRPDNDDLDGFAMRITARWALALAFAAAPLGAVTAGAQAPRPAAAPAPAPPEAGALELLSSHREELGITDAQAQRLREIALRLQAQNQPLREQLARRRADFLAQRRATLMRMTPEQRRAELARIRASGGEVPADWRPLLEQIRANQHEAMGEAQAVLTVQQKVRARALVQQWRQDRELMRASRRAPRP
jgi:hypothetical protein